MATSSDPVNGFIESVRRVMRQHEMILGGESILVAVSGGIDSVVLLDIIMSLAAPLRLKVSIAHFDHGLRDSSAEDAEFVHELSRKYGVKDYRGGADIRKIADAEGGSLEETARRERYDFLERIARRHSFNVVMTGHTADDNAETLLLNLVRGSGVTGLAGIPPTRRLGGPVFLARPLLAAKRSEVEAYAEATGLKWREDETNQSDRFKRNRVRHELLPLLRSFNPSVVETLNSTASLMRDVDRYLSVIVETAAKGSIIGEKTPGERVRLDVNQLRHLQPAVRSEVIQRVMMETFNTPPISHVAVDRVLSLLWKETGNRASLGGRFEALRDREEVVLIKNPPIIRDVHMEVRVGERLEIGEVILDTRMLPEGERPKFTSNHSIEFISADQLPETLTIRSWKEGDRFHPLGMKGEKKLSDFLIDRKVPLDRKRQVLLLTDGEQILWICGMQIDERYRITKETKRVLRLEFREGELL